MTTLILYATIRLWTLTVRIRCLNWTYLPTFKFYNAKYADVTTS